MVGPRAWKFESKTFYVRLAHEVCVVTFQQYNFIILSPKILTFN